MDIEIIIKGAVELKEFYPKKYEVFVEQVGELILNAFPGVSGWSIEEEMTRNRYEQEKKRKQIKVAVQGSTGLIEASDKQRKEK